MINSDTIIIYIILGGVIVIEIMNYILQIIQNNLILSIATIISTIIGIWGFVNSRKSKKEMKRYEYLFQLADQNIDKNLSEEELDDLKKQKDETQKKIESLNNIIKNDIPLEARKTILADKLKEQEIALGQSFEKYKKTKEEYEEIAQINNSIPDSLLREIENHIMPDYLVQQQKSRYMSMLTIISYVSAILSVIPFVRNFGSFVIVFSLYPLLKIIRLNLPKNEQDRTKYFCRIVIGMMLIILGIYNLIMFFSIIYDVKWDNGAWDIMLIVSFFTFPAFILSVLALIIWKMIKKHKRNQ